MIRRRTLVVGALLLLSAQATAQEDQVPEAVPAAEDVAASIPPSAPTPPEQTFPDTLVVAGGVSLGSYQAGFAYYYTLATHPEVTGVPNPLRFVSGASAGSINALLAAFASCKGPEYNPAQSMFYRTWIPVGMTKDPSAPKRHPQVRVMASPSAATATSLLSPEPISDIVRQVTRYYHGLDPITGDRTRASSWLQGECQTNMGFVTTREVPRTLHVQNGTSPKVPRQTEKFLLKFHKPAGGEPRFEALRPTEPNLLELFPVLGEGKQGDFSVEFSMPDPMLTDPASTAQQGTVVQLLRASASVPFAFPSTPLRFRICTNTGCGRAETMTFVDGAVYENVPVRLAAGMRRASVRTSSQVPFMTVLDTDTEGWSRYPAAAPQVDQDVGFVGSALGLGESILSSTMAAELLSAFEEHPSLRDVCDGQAAGCDALYPKRRAPTASGHFMNFLGFFDESFRVADFYLGMLDAKAFLAEKLGPIHEQASRAIKLESRMFECALDWDRESEGFSRWPDRTPRACAKLGVGYYDPGDRTWRSDRSDRSYDDMNRDRQIEYNVVRLFVASLAFRKWTESESYAPDDAQRQWIKEIRRQGVQSHVLKGKSMGVVVRDTLDAQLVSVAAKQPTFGDRVLMRIGGRIAANLLDYREPRHIFALGGNWNRALEVAYGYRPFEANWLRLEGAVRLSSLSIKAKNGGGVESFSPSARGRLVFPARESPWVQVEPYVGYARVAFYQGFFERRGMIEDALQAGIRLLAIQHIYLDLELGTCLKRHRGPACFEDPAAPAPGSPSPETAEGGADAAVTLDASRGALSFSDVTLNLGLGWRWLW